MDSNSNYVQSWILIGIIIYTGLILLVVIIRQCVKKRTFCPFCNCCYDVNCISAVCGNCNCRNQEPASTTFSCCRTNETINEASCLNIPSCKCRCFLPDCSYCRCLCCEIVCESHEKVIDMDNDFNSGL